MSTKTSIKRIALVAVASLGFGFLTMVPSKAALAAATAAAPATDFDAVTATAVYPSARVGITASARYQWTAADSQADADYNDFEFAFTAKPSGSAATISPSYDYDYNGTGTEADITVAGEQVSVTGQVIRVINEAAADIADNELVTVQVAFTPDLAGTYTIFGWHDANGNRAIDNNEQSKSITFTIAADAIAAKLTVWGSTTAADATDGALIRVELTNGAKAASLSGIESIAVSATDSVTVSDSLLTRSDFNKSGYAYVKAYKNSASSGSVISFVGAAGTGVSSISLTTTIVVKATDSDSAGADLTATLVDTTGFEFSSPNLDAPLAGGTATLKIVNADADAVSGDYNKVKIIDGTDGLLTGQASATYFVAYAIDSKFTAEIGIPVPASDAATSNVLADVLFGSDGALDISVDSEAATATTLTMDNLNFRAVNGSTVVLGGVLKDQFGSVLPNTTGNANPDNAGKNGHVATSNVVTDAAGRFSYSLADAPLAGVTATTDSVVVTVGGLAKTVAISWLASLGVSKVAVTTPDTTAGVANTTVTEKGINAGASGAQAGKFAVTAKVTDVNGSVLVGVPVTWTVSSTGAAVTSSTAVSYSDTTGVATAYVYGWVTGTYTVTAKAEAVSGTGQITLAQTEPTYVRTVTAEANGSSVTATAKDRFGNPVKGVKLYATKTGSGYFGNGSSTSEGTTDSKGQVEFVVAGGALTVTVSAVNPSSATGTTYGQTCAAAGNADCATTPTAITAYVAGTSVKDETGVGSSFASAGVSSASVEVSVTGSSDAIDAANEATDAANAATDAANAAAEAADAATAAAQDAQAAVAELATKVASLIAGIKAQITTLTNLVIKIQKKVRA
jgi:hypothetical protein